MLQVLLVTGGWDDGNNEMSSTEIYVTGSDKWEEVGNLPTPVSGLREDF